MSELTVKIGDCTPDNLGFWDRFFEALEAGKLDSPGEETVAEGRLRREWLRTGVPIREFSQAVLDEVMRNRNKGDFSDWKPGADGLIKEMEHHFDKLKRALLDGDSQRAAEYFCDVAAYCSRGWHLYKG